MTTQHFKKEVIECILELKKKQDKELIQTVEHHFKMEDLIKKLCVQLDNRFVISQIQEQQILNYIELLNKQLIQLYRQREMMEINMWLD